MTLRAGLLGLLLGAGAPAAFGQLIAYLPFENGTAHDVSGHGLNGTIVNATYTASGHTGGAFVFDGSSAYIQIQGLNISPSVFPQLTMGAWVLATDVSPIRQIISHDNGGFDRSLGLDNRGGVNGYSAFTGTGVLGGQPATPWVWTFVAVVYDQIAGTTMLYVNGATYTGTAASGTGMEFTRIGMNPAFGEYFSGRIDDVFFFSGALTGPQLDFIRTAGVLAIPEPSTTALLLAGGAILGLSALRRIRPGFSRKREQ